MFSVRQNHPVMVIGRSGQGLADASMSSVSFESLVLCNEALMDVKHNSNGPHATPGTITGRMSRTKSAFSMSSESVTSGESEETTESDTTTEQQFGQDVAAYTGRSTETPQFDTGLRKVMEPHLRKARLERRNCRSPSQLHVDESIASSLGVPYTTLRHERPFLFDASSYPLDKILAQTLKVEDLSQVHRINKDHLFNPLIYDRDDRYIFHAAYDNFVTAHCIPLLHSFAISKGLLRSCLSDRITYRYQAFPTIRVSRPGSFGSSPTCDRICGYSIGSLTFHIPLTPSFGTNAIFVESYPGREDWHPLAAKSVGLGYLFDGGRCLRFELPNNSDVSAVSIEFRVIMYCEQRGAITDDGSMTPPHVLEDRYSLGSIGYYDEASVDLTSASHPGFDVVVKKNGKVLIDPDFRSSRPF